MEFFTRRFFEQFFALIATPAVWVLDDYQQAGAATQLNEILHIASTIAPKDLTVMVLSRNDPPPVFIRQRAYQTLTLIGWDGLKLSREDAFGLAQLHQQQGDTVVNACYEASQGWMAGFILLLTQGSDANLPFAAFSADNKQVLFDYFASETFKDFPDATQTILLKTAWLPELTPELTSALTGDSTAWSVLCGFQRNNFFILQKAGAERIFEFHPLFLEFLKANAHLRMNNSALTALQEQAAGVLVQAQRAEEAIPLYLTTGNWQALAALLYTVAHTMVMQGRHQTLAVWLTAVPEQVIQQNAWLRFWRGVSRTPIDLISARQDFSAAYSLFKCEQNTVGLYLAWLNCVGTY
ncbi:MAG: hypothetical protein HOP02_14500 [Methylococcaceae bacterium]|nr:hypothetical protein [Methylococcaceae bacterium]